MRSIKEINKLIKDSSERVTLQSFIIEGKKLVGDFLRFRDLITYVVVDEDRFKSDEQLQSVVKSVQNMEIPLYFVVANTFKRVSSVRTPQGILAEIKMRHFNLADVLKKQKILITVGDVIQDPANVGVLVRNSLAFGCDAVVFTTGSADVYSPKSIRTASCCIVDIPIFYLNQDELIGLKESGVQFVVSILEGNKSLHGITRIPSKSAVVFGNEGAGISKRLVQHADESFFIPISEKVNSLNITSAVAVTLFHMSYLHTK